MQGVLLNASSSQRSSSGHAQQPPISFEVGEVDERQQGVPHDIPYSAAVLMDTAELFGWLTGRRTSVGTGCSYIIIILRYCTGILNIIVVSLFSFSAVDAYRSHDTLACVLRVIAGLYVVQLLIMHMSALGWFSEDLGSFLRKHELPPIPCNMFLAATLTLVNVSSAVCLFIYPYVLREEFGHVFNNNSALVAWCMCVIITTPPAASVLALLRCIGAGLCHRLSAVRAALEQGESAAARQAYAHYLKYLREAKPIYQSIASPVIVNSVLMASFWLSVEVYAIAGGSRFHSTQQRTWGPLTIVLLLWVAGPPIRLPVEHRRIKVLAAEIACASADRDADAAALIASMNAVGEQSGLKVLGSIPLTRERLMQVISYMSIVMGLLRRAIAD